MPRVTRIVGTHCTVERHTGQFCDAPSAEGMPFPICAKHAIKLYLWMRDTITQTDPMLPVWQLMRQQEDDDARAAERAKHLKHTVYYVKIGELVKIGYTSNMRLRMQRYPPNRWVMATEDGDSQLEHKRHRQFAALRTHANEWYRLDEPLLGHINTLRRASGAPPVDLRVSS